MKYKHLFGPVLSRRLGFSLGIDLIPYKVCSLNCVYCEVGKTTDLTLERKNYINIAPILKELDTFLATNPKLDHITFSGGGEPTLHSQIGEVISYIKTKYPQYKLALITNSSLLWDEQLRNDIKDVDLILPSLDAVSPEVFYQINRHVENLKAQQIIQGLIEFKKIFHGEMFLEIFIIEGINDSEAELTLLKNACLEIKPDLIQLNTLDRPGTEHWVKACSVETLQRIQEFFIPLKTEIIAKVHINQDIPDSMLAEIDVIEKLITNHPMTLDQISKNLNLHVNTVLKYLRYLIKNTRITQSNIDSHVYYVHQNR